MSGEFDKENIAEGLIAGSSFSKPSALSPKKPARKTRSKSIGPGGLGDIEAPLKESTGNRRKSAFIPAVKSILASNDEDEKKRREQRRKSLARRRVSFAPEATLHTWDVVEYLRDATTSSASSEASRRASSVSQASAQASPRANVPSPALGDAEPPSTPPAQVEEETLPESSPANQRDLHQKKHRRRSSGIPPMNFNNPEDVFSSSPVSGSGSSTSGSDGIEGPSDEEDEETMNQRDIADITGRSSGSDENDSTGSSARLEAALRQATAYAGTQQLDLDNADREMTMEMAEDEITAAFKPWAKRIVATPRPTRTLPSQQDQENIDPFSPAGALKENSGALAKHDDAEQDEDEDMSMDITRAIGKIVPKQQLQSPDQEDMSMDLTMALGGIKQSASAALQSRRASLKRRASIADVSQGSPAKRPAGRRSSVRRRRSSAGNSSMDDETMDLTVAIGGIKGSAPQHQVDQSENGDLSFSEETMDFTMVVGGIKGIQNTMQQAAERVLDSDQDDNEDLSMEFTNVIGGIRGMGQQATPVKSGPTPSKVQSALPKKLPGRPRVSDVKASNQSPSPKKAARTTPQKSPGRPRKSLVPATPEVKVTPQRRMPQSMPEPEPSPFITREIRSASKTADVASTPQDKIVSVEPRAIPDDPITAPILNRRRSSLASVQLNFSPIPATREEPPLKSTAVLTNSIKLLSTPRKQTLTSPVKRGTTPKKEATPKKTPTPKKAQTPRKSASPKKKRVGFGQEAPAEQQAAPQEEDNETPEEEAERISLQDFLDMTKIRFMDLTTSKRRHTAAPPSFHDKELAEKEDTLETYVMAAACTVPEYEMYQHACHELKRYISGGRDLVRQIEADVYEDNPMLFAEYVSAPPDQRHVMDTQFKNLKTFARLESKKAWYDWRSKLLGDLMPALLRTKEGLAKDETVLKKQEELLESVLPGLIEQHDKLDIEYKQLKQRQDELDSVDHEELEATREQLITADAEVEEKKRLLVALQQELAQNETHIEAIKDRKIEWASQIKEAERVREECRGWSVSEVNALKAEVTALEQTHHWTITSATPSTITMTHLQDLELFFHPAAFSTNSPNTPNAPISLTYIGDSASPHPRELTTSKRFFLQLIRAHLHCISQSQTRISDLLNLVKESWAAATAVAEGVRWLEMSYLTEETILSDERMAVSSAMLLSTLQTKVRVAFDIGVSLSAEEGVRTHVKARAEVVYGEKYKEDKMGMFLNQFVGESVRDVREMGVWAETVGELAKRLRERGRKG